MHLSLPCKGKIAITENIEHLSDSLDRVTEVLQLLRYSVKRGKQ